MIEIYIVLFTEISLIHIGKEIQNRVSQDDSASWFGERRYVPVNCRHEVHKKWKTV